MFKVAATIIAVAITPNQFAAAEGGDSNDLGCEWFAGQDVSVDDDWVEARQGHDESLHRLRLDIWGVDVVAITCKQLDDDPDSEFIITSRGAGTGPYYRLQIIDFRPDGIAAWSYASMGVPRVDASRVSLGSLPVGYQGAGTKSVYSPYRFSPGIGLVETMSDAYWYLFLTTIVDGEKIVTIDAEFSSRHDCSTAGMALVERFLSDYGEQAQFDCLGNTEIRIAPSTPTVTQSPE